MDEDNKHLEDVDAEGHNFKLWEFAGQKFQFQSCRDCRTKKKAEREASNYGGGTPTQGPTVTINSGPVMDALRKVYSKLEEIESLIKEK